jgi:M penetrans paralogue family 26
MVCPKCEKTNRRAAKFCANCGNPLTQAPQEEVAPQPILPVQQRPLPNATAVLVLGIISIVGCFCYGIVGTVLGIIALALASSANTLYQQNPEVYLESSFKNMKAGKVCAIVGLCLSGAYLVFLLIYVLFLGAAFSLIPG